MSNIISFNNKINNNIDGFIYKSESMAAIDSHIKIISPTGATVLLTGESGTGKEVIARRIHELSGRNGKFIAVNCSAIVSTLLESELFGHEKGAFTDAASRRIGKFEQASGGTILLDEIAEMDKYLQVKLLRVVQEMSMERVGGNEPIKIDARIIAATNKNIETAVKEGTFRGDLFYRLNVMRLHLPPLRDRREDILPLADSFLKLFCERYSREYKGIGGEFRRYLESLDYPGNIRELKNIIERVVVMSQKTGLPDISDLGDTLSYQAPLGEGCGNKADELKAGRMAGSEIKTLNIREMEKELVAAALKETSGNMTKAAEKLGITARTIRNKLKGIILPSESKLLPPPCLEARGKEDLLKNTGHEEVNKVPYKSLKESINEIEKSFISLALDRSGGNKAMAADMLGMNRTTLIEKLRRNKKIFADVENKNYKGLSSAGISSVSVSAASAYSLAEKYVEEAQKRLEIIKPLLGANTTRKQVETRGREFGVSVATMYHWIRRYKIAGDVNMLIPGYLLKGGRGVSRLPDETESVIERVLEKEYLKSGKLMPIRIYKEIAMQCKRSGIPIPAINTVRNRIKEINSGERKLPEAPATNQSSKHKGFIIENRERIKEDISAGMTFMDCKNKWGLSENAYFYYKRALTGGHKKPFSYNKHGNIKFAENKDAIIADIAAGMTFRACKNKWNMRSKVTFLKYKKLAAEKTGVKVSEAGDKNPTGGRDLTDEVKANIAGDIKLGLYSSLILKKYRIDLRTYYAIKNSVNLEKREAQANNTEDEDDIDTVKKRIAYGKNLREGVEIQCDDEDIAAGCADGDEPKKTTDGSVRFSPKNKNASCGLGSRGKPMNEEERMKFLQKYN
ncbi:MAG: sigma 54-interacting transcriptional regulator [bacterium]